MFVPIKPMSKKKKKNEQINEALTLIKSFADNDPRKSIINFLTTEMEKSRDYELRIMQAMFASPTAFSNGQKTGVMNHTGQAEKNLLGPAEIRTCDLPSWAK